MVNISPDKFVGMFMKQYGKSSASELHVKFGEELSRFRQIGLQMDKKFIMRANKLLDAQISKEDLIEEVERLELSGATSVADTQAIAEGQSEINIIDGKPPETVTIKSYTGRKGENPLQLKGMRAILKQLSKKVDNMKPLFRTIGKDWFASNPREIFSQSGPGKAPGHADYSSDRYRDYKRKMFKAGDAVGEYPILVFRGTLRAIMADPEDQDSIFVVYKKSMQLGTRNEVAMDLAAGKGSIVFTGKVKGAKTVDIPPRFVVQLGSRKRINRWYKMARNYLNTYNTGELKNV